MLIAFLWTLGGIRGTRMKPPICTTICVPHDDCVSGITAIMRLSELFCFISTARIHGWSVCTTAASGWRNVMSEEAQMASGQV